ncbi:MAG: adenylyltransferase/cytidyltransferase family protein [Candidatus Nanoarchaeia archaeon]|nr:adenylyltransferase/cytidyltransferase family protein [Candidatus Nanoarchaeia archaeon]
MKKVITWGKFDRLHKGHISFLKNAKKLGILYVIIVSSKSKCYKNCIKNSDLIRKKNLLKLKFIEDVFITKSFNEGIKYIIKLSPDIYVFGHDQKVSKIKNYLSKNKCFPKYKRLKVYNKGIHNKDLF